MKHHEEAEKENSERWLLTYADLITLLLIFFIIMYTISSVDKNKFKAVAESMNAAMGSVLQYQDGKSIIPMTPDGDGSGSEDSETKKMADVEEKINKMVESEGMVNEITVTEEERGLVVSIHSFVLFDSGSAKLTTDADRLVERIANILSTLSDKQIRVEGHTDNDPIRTAEFPSNWELSSARATNVLRILIDKAGLNPAKLSATGYGEFRPKVPNTTSMNKAQNRRVDIVILKTEYDKVDPHGLNSEQR